MTFLQWLSQFWLQLESSFESFVAAISGTTPPAGSQPNVIDASYTTVPDPNAPIDASTSSDPGTNAGPSPATGLSPNGLNFIISQEGFSPTAYADGRGHMSIGYGHQLTIGDGLSSSSVITESQAQSLLQRDASSAVACLRSKLSTPLTLNQFDALVSFVYNIGCANFSSSTMLTKLRNGDFAGASQEFPRWIYATAANGTKTLVQGLVNRRAAEQALFNA
jgi:lysozyme